MNTNLEVNKYRVWFDRATVKKLYNLKLDLETKTILKAIRDRRLQAKKT